MAAGHPHTGRVLARLEAVTGAARLADAVPLPATPDGSLGAGTARTRTAGSRPESPLAVAAAGSSLATFLIAGVLRGTAVMNGSARGTSLVVLLIGVPLLAGSMLAASRGSARAVLAWLGAAAFLLYNSLMFVFATPVNRLFLLYLAMLSLSAWSIATVLWQADVRALAGRFSPRVPVRGIAAYVWVVVTLNAAAWLARIVPALADSGTPAFLRGTGLSARKLITR